MGNNVTRQGASIEPSTPARNHPPASSLQTSPPRSPLSPARKRQGGGQVSPASSPAPASAALSLHQISEEEEFTVDFDQEIGEGSFATVRLGKRVRTGEVVAVKVIEKKTVPPEMKHLIEHEYNILRQLNHPSVIKLLHAAEDRRFIYFFMPYFAGGDVHTFFEQYERLTEPAAFRIFHQLVDAVEHCHLNHVIHRDIKLENMLIDNATDMNVTLIDFGFSTLRRPTDPLLEDYPGSPAYAAPELMQGIPYPGYSSDVWAMGVCLYVLLTGEYPFWSEDRRQMFSLITKGPLDFSRHPYLSQDCQDLLSSLLKKDWRERPSVEQIRSFSWFSRHWVSFRPTPKPTRTLSSSGAMEVDGQDTMETPRGSTTPVSKRKSGGKGPATPCTPMSGVSTPKSGKSTKKSKWTPTFHWQKKKLVF